MNIEHKTTTALPNPVHKISMRKKKSKNTNQNGFKFDSSSSFHFVKGKEDISTITINKPKFSKFLDLMHLSWDDLLLHPITKEHCVSLHNAAC